MIGFELIVKGEKISGALERGVLSVILTQIVNEDGSITLDFSGLDTTGSKHHRKVVWNKSKLKQGDQITINILDIDEVSQPIENHERKIKSKDQNKGESCMKK